MSGRRSNLQMNIKNKKILITAGPTWVPIDRVRVISNISSGRTGITLAQYAAREGADVTLLLGPVNSALSPQPSAFNLRILRFRYFDDLKRLILQELSKYSYDIIIHAAAVSDYIPVKVFKGKMPSTKKNLTISLKPAIKLVGVIRRRAAGAIVVMFKLEVGKVRGKLIDIARKAMRSARADLIVANNLDEITTNRHKAYILDQDKNIVMVRTKKDLTRRLFDVISERL